MLDSVNISDGLVGASRQYQRDIGLCNSEDFSYGGLRHGATKLAYSNDFFGNEKFFVARNETAIDGMLLVESICGPFKVGCNAIRFDPVNVINDRKPIWVRDEGESYQPMYQESSSFAPIEKGNLVIAAIPPTEARTQNLSVACLQAKFSHSESINTTDSPAITDFITFTEFGDGDTPPLFDEHNMGPFARSAHIIASFCAHQGE